ncbi:hypothetical protein Tmar_0364 [Thermaerobacter marianensis DSM 12885]|uniref:Uncharacterized protein n=1 Tax=Thermaerobacter marianensis (strain ATCC 700841 / DSM 12885 / JCM 10246 / 7p75a) TaxID=644966 RepID=E6SG70_THEM7|nr:hypothetical protein [Thermaerobacter marianensis]ADU50487.1 hypothetical protein Tmar_0364 [Thermaerobacter marianensis DSM 12885]
MYPEEYRYAKWPEAYATNFPGTAYLNTQASDDETEENWTVGTLDAGEFEPYVQYYADIIGSPDYPGTNWWKLYFELGVIDAPLCGITVSPEWCMLYPHDRYMRIPFTYHYTFPGGIYWYGQ